VADGEVSAVFKGLAEDAEQVAVDVVTSMARIADDTASIEEGNLAHVLGADVKAAGEFEALGGKDVGLRGVPSDVRTKPSRPFDPSARPRGTPTVAHPTKLRDRSLRRENESADALARDGYDVEQNPPPKPNGKEPDYKVEGRYFDCYSPTSDDPDNVRDGISKKVRQEQADRIVLNLDDCPASADQIAGILRRKPISGLQEVLVVRNGQVMELYSIE
jgi:hypothetical protein